MSFDESLREIEKLQGQLAARDAALADRDAKLADRDALIERLASDLETLQSNVKRLLAGRGRGHLIDEGQAILFPDAPPVEDAENETPAEGEETPEHADEAPDGETAGDRIPRKHRRKSSARKIDTSGLPRVEKVHELPEEERFCPESGLPLVATGEKTFDEIGYQRPQLFLVHHRQIVYSLSPEDAAERQATTLIAPLPARPLDGCKASATLLSIILTHKYSSHVPLNRQEAIFARDGLRLPRQTLCDWVLGAASVLAPIADRLMVLIRAGPICQLDDTPVKCQRGKGKTHFQAYLWTFVNPEVEGVAYRFTPGRGSDLIAELIEGLRGFLVGDGYSGNKAAARKVSLLIILAGCWAHTTRKFRDAQCEASAIAQLFRDDIKRLYAVEAEADDAGLDSQARCDLRRQKSRGILASLLARGRRLKNEYSDAGKLAGAIRYMLNQRKPLRRFLEDGRVPLDNNACERSIRPIAVGRRNWLFAGSVKGGHAAATIYTLVESCRLAGVDVERYLADVLVRVATHPASRIDELLPSNWKVLVDEAPADAAPVPQLV